MSHKCINNYNSCLISVDKIIDKSKGCNNVNSNICTTFNIESKCEIPPHSKVKIVKAELECRIVDIEREFLLNGQEAPLLKDRDKDYLLLTSKYINLCDECVVDIKVNIIERIKMHIVNKVYIWGVAYCGDCREICFRGCGECEDIIETIVGSNLKINNFCNFNEKIKIIVENELIPSLNLQTIYLSPLCGCSGCIEYLVGNIYPTYGVELYLRAIRKENIGVLSDNLIPRKIDMFKICQK